MRPGSAFLNTAATVRCLTLSYGHASCPVWQIEYHYSRLLGTDWREQMEADFLEAAREVQDGLLTGTPQAASPWSRAVGVRCYGSIWAETAYPQVRHRKQVTGASCWGRAGGGVMGQLGAGASINGRPPAGRAGGAETACSQVCHLRKGG